MKGLNGRISLGIILINQLKASINLKRSSCLGGFSKFFISCGGDKKMKTFRLLIATSFLLLGAPAYADLSQENGVFTISSRAVTWGLQFPEGDFQLQMEKHSPDRLNHYYRFASKQLQLNASFTLEPAGKCVTSKECRDFYLNNPNPLIVNPKRINHFDLNKFAVVEFFLPEYKGVRIDQMNLSAHYVKDGYWVDMHLSKMRYQPSERSLFTNFANSVSIRNMEAIPNSLEKDSDSIMPREFKIPGRGVLILEVPRSWLQYAKQASDEAPPTLVMRPRSGEEFQLLLTPLWSPKNAKGFNSAENVKEFVSFSARQLAPNAVEKELVVEPIPREKGSAFYFFATDRASRNGEHPYLIQGAIGMDDLVITLTLLFRNKESEVVDTVLNLFSTLRKNR